MRDELHVLLRHMLGEGEGAGADRSGGELVAEFLGRLFADDVAAVIVRDPAEKIRIGIFQHDADRVVVDLGDAVDPGEIGREGRALWVRGTRQRINDVVRRQLAPVAMELDAFAQEEGPGPAVGRVLPAFRQIRLDVLGVGAAGRKADEPIIHPAEYIQPTKALSVVDVARCASIVAISEPLELICSTLSCALAAARPPASDNIATANTANSEPCFIFSG